MVEGLRIRVQGLEFGVNGSRILGFRVWGLEFSIHGSGYRGEGCGIRVARLKPSARTLSATALRPSSEKAINLSTWRGW